MPNPNARFLITADDKASKTLRKVKEELKSTTSSAKNLAASFGVVLAGGALARQFVDVALTTEKLRASLETVTGSAGAANAAFESIKQFTATTPFQIEQVSSAFIKLSAYGIKPTEKLLRSLGNTASAFGKPLDQAVEALADAATGEFERLKEFGIKARSEGDKVAFTFRGVTTEVNKSADEITAYLRNIGETDFAGSMERQAATLGGALSNLQDTVFNLADELNGRTGLSDALRAVTIELTNMLQKLSGPTLDELANKLERLQQVGRLPGRSGKSTYAFQVRELGSDINDALRNLPGPEGIRQQLSDVEDELRDSEQKIRELIVQINQIPDDQRAKTRGTGRSKTLTTYGRLAKELQQANEAAAEQIKEREQLQQRLEAVELAFDNTGGGESRPTTKTKKRSGKSDAQIEAEKFAEALRRLQDELDPVSAKTREYFENVALLDRAWVQGQISGEQYDLLMKKLATDTDAVAEAEKALASDRQKAVDLIQQFDPASGITAQIAEVERLRDLFPQLSDALGDVSLDLQEKFDAIGEDGVEAADKVNEAWKDLGLTFASAFEDAIVEGENLSDVLDALEKDIIRIITRNLVTQPLANSISGLLGGIGGGGFDISSIFGGARAEGGPIDAGRAYLVGEEGPEIIVPRSSQTVIPMKGEGRSRSTNITINMSGMSGDQVRRSADQVAAKVARAVGRANARDM